ncbi:MAG: HAD-IIA family hydrolase [Chloroflexota bacterium]
MAKAIPPKNYLIDMDGVLVSGKVLIEGADGFIQRLKNRNAKFLVMTNNPMYTPRDLAHNLLARGLDIPEANIFTSAMATARFLHAQRPNGTAFVIGESGLTTAIHDIGYIISEHNPDYVVLGETESYNLEQVTKAVRLVAAGARFIATNPDPSGPSEHGLVPACGAMAALIERATRRSPFFVGKPNPLMVRSALKYMDAHSVNTIIIGDRMDTDIVSGVESGIETILVLTGVTHIEDVAKFPYIPTQIVNSVADINP